MTTLAATSPSRSAPPDGWRIWYRTGIVVVAVLLLGLPWTRTGRTGFQAQGQASLTTSSDHPEAHDHLQPLVDELLEKAASNERLAAYLDQYAPLREEFASVDADQAVEILRRRLEVAPVRRSDQTLIQVGFYGTHRDACSLLVHQLLKDCRADFDAWKDDKTATIREAYQSKQAAAQADLANIEDQLRPLREIRLEPSTEAQPRRLPNPDWTALAEEIAANQRQIRAMLETRTAQHPQVQELTRRIQRLEQRLQDTPRHLAPSAEAQSLAAQAAEEVARRQKEIAQLEQRRRDAQDRLAAVEKLKTDADEAIVFLEAIVFHAPGERIQVAAVGGHWKPTTVMLVLGWAIFAGLIAYQLAWTAALPEWIVSPRQLAAVAPIPIVGVLTMTSGNPQPRPSFGGCRRCSFAAARIAEVTLIALAACVVLAFQTRPGFEQLFWDDPVSALRHAVTRE